MNGKVTLKSRDGRFTESSTFGGSLRSGGEKGYCSREKDPKYDCFKCYGGTKTNC